MRACSACIVGVPGTGLALSVRQGHGLIHRVQPDVGRAYLNTTGIDSFDLGTVQPPTMTEREATNGDVSAEYIQTEDERVLAFERDGSTAVVAQNREGYAMLKVRSGVGGDERERYYGFEMALDHAAELLGVSPHDLPVPESAEDMGM